MQQLDLFGFPIETPAPKKKEKAPKATAQPEATAAPEGVTVAAVPVVIEEPLPVQEAEPDAVIETVTAPQEEIITIAEPVVIQQQETVAVAESPVITEVPVMKRVAAIKQQAGKRGRKSFKEMDNEADLVEVPEDEILKQKLYYSISEVAGWFKVNTSLLRYWENEFDVLQPRKTRKGDRLFRVEDIKNLQLIYFLLRQRKFSIDGAKNYLKNNKQEADTQIRLVESLTKFRSFLLEMKANLQA